MGSAGGAALRVQGQYQQVPCREQLGAEVARGPDRLESGQCRPCHAAVWSGNVRAGTGEGAADGRGVCERARHGHSSRRSRRSAGDTRPRQADRDRRAKRGRRVQRGSDRRNAEHHDSHRREPRSAVRHHLHGPGVQRAAADRAGLRAGAAHERPPAATIPADVRNSRP